MSQTIVSVIINLLVTILPFFGVTVGSDELTNAVQVLVAIGTGLYIWYRRVKVGDVSTFGARKR